MRRGRAHVAGANDGNFFPCTHDSILPRQHLSRVSQLVRCPRSPTTGSFLPLCYDLREAESKGAVLKVSRNASADAKLAFTRNRQRCRQCQESFFRSAPAHIFTADYVCSFFSDRVCLIGPPAKNIALQRSC